LEGRLFCRKDGGAIYARARRLVNGIPDTLYRQITADLARQIRAGVMQAGSRLSSIRQLAKQRQVSISTAIRSMQVLDECGLDEACPQSDYDVRTASSRLSQSSVASLTFRGQLVDRSELV
jgi:DNA-binding transcriptional MocR family regulator